MRLTPTFMTAMVLWSGTRNESLALPLHSLKGAHAAHVRDHARSGRLPAARALSGDPRHDRGAVPAAPDRGLRPAGNAGREPHAMASRPCLLVLRDLHPRAEPAGIPPV